MLTIRGLCPGQTLALLSGVHGDEWEGVVAVGRLCRLLRTHEIRGRVLVVSICNEPAFEAMSRTTPDDGRDMARCLPGDPGGSLTQRLAAVLADQVIRQADFLIDLHSAGLHYTMPTLVGYTGGDSAAGRASALAARWFGAPVIWRHPPPAPPGRTISLAFDLDIPSLYAETTGAGELREADVDCYTRGVQNVLRMLSMLDGDGRRRRALSSRGQRGPRCGLRARSAWRGAGPRRRVAAAPRSRRRGRDHRQPFGEVVETLTAGRRGVVVMLRHTPRVAAGDRICHLADTAEDEPEGEDQAG